jgi:type II secretory pathway component GspD/PulD (secretin)
MNLEQSFMITKLVRSVLAVFVLCGGLARAQTNVPPPKPVSSAITLDKMAAVSSNPLGVDTNVISQLTLDSELPLSTVIQSLADTAKLKIRYAPELLVNDKPGPLLSAPVGEAKFEQMTAFEALVRLLRRNDLILGRYANSPDVLIGTRTSRLTPVTPEVGGDLDTGPGQAEMDIFMDPNAEIPLQTAIVVLARIAKVPIIMDPKLRTGGERFVGTNVISVPSITNITVNLSGMIDSSAKQRLNAILNAHDLMLASDPGSQTFMVTYKEPGAKEPLLPNVVTLRYANTTNVQDLLTTTFGPTVKVRADTRTASLLILSTAKDYDSITNLIAKLDTPTKQVLIEARFLETLQNPKSLKGVDWSGTLAANQITFGNGVTAAQTTRNSGSTTTPTTTPNGRPGPAVTTTSGATTREVITTQDPTAAVPISGFSLDTAKGFNPSTAFLNAQGVSAVLSFLNTEADTRTLATPRAVTLDNQETRLEVTRAIPIFDASEGIGQAGTTVSSSKPNYTNVGTILIVTPRISGTNVQMRLRPEISRVEAQPSRKVVAGKVNEADIFSTSKIDTHVVVPSGNTLVMGGLISDSTFKTYQKVPFLGDIPVLGWAFRREGHERSKANLIIFLTPTIIEDEDYQPYRTGFLNERMPEHPKFVDDPITGGKPARITKKAKAKAAADEAGK